MSVRVASLAVLALLATATSSVATGSYAGTSDVTLVEIPVHVVRNGKAVANLTRDDFEITEGKKKHAIQDFEMIDLRRIAADDVPVMARRHVLFLFDLSSLDPATVARAQTMAVTATRDMLHPSDLAAVGSYSAARGASVVLGFTSDRDQASLAIETLGVPGLFQPGRDALGLVVGERTTTGHATSGQRSAAGDLAMGFDAAQAVCLHARTLDNDRVRASAAERRAEIAAKSHSLAELANLLSRVDGRKQVVLFSAGFDSDLFLASGEGALDHRATTTGEIWDVDGDRVFGSTATHNDLEEMLESFRRADATIQAIDLRRATTGTQALTAERDGATRAMRAESLFYLAHETGGGLHRGTRNLQAAMNRAFERSNVTYLLTFQPRRLALDGAYHPIKVRVKRGGRGLRVTHRPGYFAPVPWSSEDAEVRRVATAQLVTGRRDAGTLPLAVTAWPATQIEGETMVPFLVQVDGPGVLTSHYGDVLNVELHIYVFDRAGDVVGFRNQLLTLDVTTSRSRIEKSGIAYYDALPLPPGAYRARVVVRNNEAWTWGTQTSTFDVAPARDTGSELDGAGMDLVPRGDWVVARSTRAEAVPYPLTADGEPLLPRRVPVPVGGRAKAGTLP